MRIIISFFGAILVILMLFYIMIGFIRTDQLPEVSLDSPTLVNIQKANKGNGQKNRQVSKIKKPSKEPVPNLNNTLMADVKPNPATINIQLKLETSPVQLEMAALPKLQKNWVQPTSLDTSNSSKGLDDEMSGEPKSINKITPVSTRMPFIPKVAWDNKVNGWVLLAFTVTSEGRVKDIRVLDASPKGVFEESAVLSATDWRYPGFIGYDRYVSQKIEFEWKYYPYNLDY
jgi:protein TonB